MNGEKEIRESAAFRGEGRFDEAIELIEGVLDSVHPDIRFNALREVFEAAREKGDLDLATKYARLMADEHPDFPAIQDYI